MSITQFYLTVTKETAQFTGPDDLLLTSGSAGVYQVSISADSHWDGLALEAVFVAAPASWPAAQNATVIRRSVSLVDGIALVPEDVLSKAGYMLYAGLSGIAEGVEKNSTLALIRRIQPGADPDGPGNEDIPQTRYAALLDMIGDLSNLDTEDQSSLVAAVNELFNALGSMGNMTWCGEWDIYAEYSYGDVVSYNGCAYVYIYADESIAAPIGTKPYADDTVWSILAAGGSSDSSQNVYELPVATSETLGGVMPVAKTEDMATPVGVDASGVLYVDGYTKAYIDTALGAYITDIDTLVGGES